MNNNYLISLGTYYKYLEGSISEHFKSLKDDGHDINCHVDIDKFNDGEVSVKFQQSLRGKHLFVFGEVTRNLTELIMTIDAAKRSSVKEITVVLPYYGYSRQDKRESTRGCIGASAIAHVLQGLGVNRIVSIDLHAEQIQGYFQIPFEHIRGRHIFSPWMKKRDLSNAVICSPDGGGFQRAAYFANEFNLNIVTIDKIRDRPGHIKSMRLTGDVTGKDVYLIDDIADTCGTLIKAKIYLMEQGARNVYCLVTHPIMSGDAKQKIIENGVNLITSNTLDSFFKGSYEKHPHFFIEVLSCGEILAETIERIANEESISIYA